MTPFLALHQIAAQRGDGLHPELVKLLARPPAIAEPTAARLGKAESENVIAIRPPGDLIQDSSDSLDQGTFHIPKERK